MKVAGLVLIIILAAAILGITYFCQDDWCFIFPWQKTQTRVAEPAYVSEKIKIESPRKNSIISSPVLLRGEARGFWYFEATFPVRLLDGSGKEVAVIPVQARGEWMTQNFVPFEAQMTFQRPLTPSGTLVFEKDNPSGLSEFADSVRIPVHFK